MSSRKAFLVHAVSAVLFFGALVQPESIQEVKLRRMSVALKVGMNVHRPPRAALLDELILPVAPVLQYRVLRNGQRPLVAGAVDLKDWAEASIAQFSKIEIEKKIMAPVRRVPIRLAAQPKKSTPIGPMKLAGLTLRKTSPNMRVMIKNAPDILPTSLPVLIGKKEVSEKIEVESDNTEIAARVEKAQGLRELAQSNWGAPTLRQRFEELAEKEKIRNGNPAVLVKGPSPKPKPTITEQNKDGLGSPSKESPWPKFVWLKGDVQLSGGLAMASLGSQLRVRRVVAGQTLEAAEVRPGSADYQLLVNHPKQGSIVAELISESGQVEGRSEILLRELADRVKSARQYVKLDLKVAGLQTRWTGRPVSYYSVDNKHFPLGTSQAAVVGADIDVRTDARGRLNFDFLADGFQFFMETIKKGFVPSLSMVNENAGKEILVLKSEDIDQLYKLVSKERAVQRSEQAGIVWGRVLINGKTVKGAKIEFSGTESAAPIYFPFLNIPDLSKTETGSNGQFALLNLRPGMQLLRVSYKGRQLPPRLVQIKTGKATLVNLDYSNKQAAEIYVFDSHTGEAISGEARFLGADKIQYYEEGYFGVKYYRDESPLILEVNPTAPGYERTYFVSPRRGTYFNVALPKPDWLAEVRAKFSIVNDTNGATVFGILREDGGRVVVPDTAIRETTKAVYFDQNGKVLEQGDHAPAGGGFVLFNVEPGLHQFGIYNDSSEKWLPQIVLTDQQTTTVMNTLSPGQ